MSKSKAPSQDTLAAMHGDTSWFTRDRFGLFIHWGLYASHGNAWGRHETGASDEAYQKYSDDFDPDLFDPKLWARTAADAGMKYFVITTKHHEGFCLWDSKLTDYKVTKTPYGKDLLKPMVDAFRKEGLRAGFYYSLLDWHHPQFVLDPHIGPYRTHPDREKMNATRDQRKYAEYMRGQVKELLTQFGDIDVMWLDFSYTRHEHGKGHKDWESEKLLALVRKLRPKILLNDRLDLPYGWDFKTPEQIQPRDWMTVDGKKVVWEACQTLCWSWGYNRDDLCWRDTDEIIRTLIDCVSKGGNLLLNIGPTGRGTIDEKSLARLQGIGKWMRDHGDSIYGCTQAPAEFACPKNCSLTYNPEKKRLYVHLLAWPYCLLHLDGKAYVERVKYARLLNDASEITTGISDFAASGIGGVPKETLVLNLPLKKPNVDVPVIELTLS